MKPLATIRLTVEGEIPAARSWALAALPRWRSAMALARWYFVPDTDKRRRDPSTFTRLPRKGPRSEPFAPSPSETPDAGCLLSTPPAIGDNDCARTPAHP